MLGEMRNDAKPEARLVAPASRNPSQALRQPLAAGKSAFDFMKAFSALACSRPPGLVQLRLVRCDGIERMHGYA
jgi:hypothetical protein